MATSTDIMTSALLDGMKENGIKTILFAICQIPAELNQIKDYYADKADKVITLPSDFGFELTKYKMLMKLLQRSLIDRFYQNQLKAIIKDISVKPDIIIAHTPSFEAVCYAKIIKKLYCEADYFQYWSDPLALSGITPDNLNIKRLPFRLIESNALKSADKIIYGTKTLMQFQKELYPELAYKMNYIDIPYVNKETTKQKVIPFSILYAGNYHKNIRNIDPLIDAIESTNDYTLDIYGDGEIRDREMKRTRIHGRISADELSRLEGKYEYLVCVLNHSCIQIPGKIFYDMNRNVKILVLADGKYKRQICDYLNKYNRFVVCENEQHEIVKALLNNLHDKIDLEYINDYFSPKSIVKTLLNGGVNENS